MKRYLRYLGYVLRHKWFVFVESLKFGIPWLGVTHDWSKFRLSEFIPYARYFYNSNGSLRDLRDETGYYKPTNTGDQAFDFAWLLHQKRNKHHWQWWVLPEDEGGLKTLPIEERYLKELLADWIGAGRAQGTPHTRAWYQKHRDKMQLDSESRKWIESQLEV